MWTPKRNLNYYCTVQILLFTFYTSASHLSLLFYFVLFSLSIIIYIYIIYIHPVRGKIKCWIKKIKAKLNELKREDQDTNEKEIKAEKKEPEREYQVTFIDVNIFGAQTIYMIIFLLCSILSLAFSGYFYPLCLLYIIYNNDILMRVLRAVTKNGM